MKLAIVLWLIAVAGFSFTVATIACKIFEGEIEGHEVAKCEVTKIFRTFEEPHFNITAPKADIVLRFDITESVIPVWTPNVCNTFPNLVRINAHGNFIHKIQENAFDNCTKLEYLNLSDNKIKHFEFILKKLANLAYLLLSNNELTSIDVDSFGGQVNLLVLQVNDNKILDIDDHKLLERCPKLQELVMDGNKLLCTRQEMLKTHFNKLKPDLEVFVGNSENDCLTEAMWKAEFLELDYESQQVIIKTMFGTQNYLFEHISLVMAADLKATKNMLTVEDEKLRREFSQRFRELKDMNEQRNNQGMETLNTKIVQNYKQITDLRIFVLIFMVLTFVIIGFVCRVQLRLVSKPRTTQVKSIANDPEL